MDDTFTMNLSRTVEPNQIAQTLEMSASYVNHSLAFKRSSQSNFGSSIFVTMKNPSLVNNSLVESRRLFGKRASKQSEIRDSKSPKDKHQSKILGLNQVSTKKNLHTIGNSPKPLLKESKNTLNTSRGQKNDSQALFMSSMLLSNPIKGQSKQVHQFYSENNLIVLNKENTITEEDDTLSALAVLNKKYNLGLSTIQQDLPNESSRREQQKHEKLQILNQGPNHKNPFQYSFLDQQKRSYEEYQTAGFGNEDEVKIFESQVPMEFRSKVFESHIQSEVVEQANRNPQLKNNLTIHEHNVFKQQPKAMIKEHAAEVHSVQHNYKPQGNDESSSGKYLPTKPSTESCRGTIKSGSEPYSREEFSLGSFGTKFTRRTATQNPRKILSKSPKRRKSQPPLAQTCKNLVQDFCYQENNPSLINTYVSDRPHQAEKPPQIPQPNKDMFLKKMKSKYEKKDLCTVSPRVSINRLSYRSIRSGMSKRSRTRSNSPHEEPKSYAISSVIKTRVSQQNLHETPLSPVRSLKKLNLQTSAAKTIVNSVIQRYPVSIYDISSYLKYFGTLNNKGQYEGYGKIVANDKEVIYEGDFRDGKYDGIGTIKNYLYNKEGFLSSMPSLKSKIKLKFFSIASPNLVKDIYRAKVTGKMNFSDKDWVSYTGGFKKGKIHGYGTLAFKNGHVFEGRFIDGKATGLGIQKSYGFNTMGLWDKNQLTQYY